MSRRTRFLDACYRRATDCTPVWLMRQAGRYQPSYRALRRQLSFMELCKTPELAARVTVNAATELGVDAAIIFSDILVAAEAMGATVQLTEAGPVLPEPVGDAAAVERLQVADPTEAVPYLLEAVRLARRQLEGVVPLIGFAGAPLTLATYLVEGGHSRSYSKLRQMIFAEPQTAHRLMDKLARTVLGLLRAQAEAGCQALQVFDSWGGLLGPADYRVFVLPYLQQIMEGLSGCGAPRILFATGASSLLELMGESGAEVIGVDWRVPLDEARRRLGPERAVMGNLDPGCLFMPEAELEGRVEETLRQWGGGPGHIFNLGHGVLPETSQERARFLVETVHRLSARTGRAAA
jgi:uroporphyrinogen decarboxylase